MTLRLGPITLPWPGKAEHDPYWDFFINTPAADPRNVVPELIKQAPEGVVAPVKADIHTPEITSSHVKEFGFFLGADLMGIVKLTQQEAAEHDTYPYAIITIVKADHDPLRAPGIGGQVPVQDGQYVTFVLAAYIRELGFRATAQLGGDGVQLALRAGLGHLNSQGRLVTPKYGSKVYVADVIYTDIPLAADGS
jgi:hypothetical protein